MWVVVELVFVCCSIGWDTFINLCPVRWHWSFGPQVIFLHRLASTIGSGTLWAFQSLDPSSLSLQLTGVSLSGLWTCDH